MENNKLVGLLHSTVESFRLGMEGQGSQALVELIDSLSQSLIGLRQEDMAPLNTVLVQALEAQQRKDYLYVADVLEYRLKPFLQHR